jgi:hypothetical protein
MNQDAEALQGPCRVVADITEPGRLVGWVTAGDATVDLLGSRKGSRWEIYGGSSDQFRGEGRESHQALVAFARACGATSGTVEVCLEYRGKPPRHYTF